MTQEDKQLVVQDICARLPYNVIVEIKSYGQETQKPWFGELSCKDLDCFLHDVAYKSIKPYLRPISSMTESEKGELRNTYSFLYSNYPFDYEDEDEDEDGVEGHYEPSTETYDWYNKKMFDYRGLIPKGLALEAPEGMYEHETKLDFHVAQPEDDTDAVNENDSRIKVGCKIRSKTNPNIILSIISDDCHGDEFECSNGSVLSLKQIEKYYDLYIEKNKGTIVIN